tara:strand:- start:262 stop:834 length:573 start_codon:yes stop_codon:yes gene_type:complete
MANDIKITSSLEAVINDSKTGIGGNTYTIKEVDKNVGNSGGSYTQSYTAADAVKYSGVVSAKSSFTAIASAFESVTTVGTAPSEVKALSLKVDSQTGTARTVDLELTVAGNVSITHTEFNDGDGSGASGTSVIAETLPVVLARLSSGESCVIPLSDTDGSGLPVANIKIKDAGYVDGSAESTVTAILIGG